MQVSLCLAHPLHSHLELDTTGRAAAGRGYGTDGADAELDTAWARPQVAAPRSVCAISAAQCAITMVSLDIRTPLQTFPPYSSFCHVNPEGLDGMQMKIKDAVACREN